MEQIKLNLPIKRKASLKKQQHKARIQNSLSQKVEVQEIPARSELAGYEKPKPRVCAYCRVSTDVETQALSYELQVQSYTEYIMGNPEWEFAGIFADRGISGTSLRHRDEFNRMIAECQAGHIDLIITKAVTRFARNVLDCISTVRDLKRLNPPVGVYFETERLNTLDSTSETYLGMISLFAQGESETKSESLKWSYIRRWKRGTGIYPAWSLMGYDVDEEGNWIIVEEEAELVRIIYDMYLHGHSSPQIADVLTRSGVPTATGRDKWTSGAVLGILRNEKYCGDVLCQKTMVIDVFSHKAVKNRGQKKQYFIEGHHAAIIEKSDWQQVQDRIRNWHYSKHRHRKKPRIVGKGCLAGFLLVDLGWSEEDISQIICTTTEEAAASISIYKMRINALYNHFRDSYDGHDGIRGRADQTVVKYSLLAPIVVAGEESADEAAIRERSIELLFSKKDVQKSEYRQAFNRVMRKEAALTSLGRTMLKAALETVPETVKSWYEEGLRQFSQDLPSRIVNNLACCYAGLKLTEALCASFKLSWDTVFPISFGTCTACLETATKEYLLDGGTHNQSVVEQAFEIMARMQLDPRCDYTMSDDGTILYLRLTQVYDKYTKYRKDYAIQGEVLPYNQFKKQLLHSDLVIESSVQKRIGALNSRCWAIDFTTLQSRCDVVGFEHTDVVPLN